MFPIGQIGDLKLGRDGLPYTSMRAGKGTQSREDTKSDDSVQFVIQSVHVPTISISGIIDLGSESVRYPGQPHPLSLLYNELEPMVGTVQTVYFYSNEFYTPNPANYALVGLTITSGDMAIIGLQPEGSFNMRLNWELNLAFDSTVEVEIEGPEVQ